MKAIEDRLTRDQIVAALIVRDGTRCAHPEANHELDFSAEEGPAEVTIDHWIPQWYGRDNGWTQDEIWDLGNLKLMCKKHNAKKGDLLPNPDDTLPEKATKTFRYRRQKRAQRPEVCTYCQAGRMLSDGEWCNACGHGPNPGRYPKWRQMSPKECDHDLFYCVSCTVWFPDQRRSVLDALLTGGEGYE